MFATMQEIPKEVLGSYENLQEAYMRFKEDLRDYQISLTPRYVSVPQYYSEIGITASYEEMKELAERAHELSRRHLKPIKTGVTPIGVLSCFYEDLLDSAFDDMTGEEDEE